MNRFLNSKNGNDTYYSVGHVSTQYLQSLLVVLVTGSLVTSADDVPKSKTKGVTLHITYVQAIENSCSIVNHGIMFSFSMFTS